MLKGNMKKSRRNAHSVCGKDTNINFHNMREHIKEQLYHHRKVKFINVTSALKIIQAKLTSKSTRRELILA